MVLGQVATDHRDLSAGRETVDLQRLPDDLVQVDDGLIIAEGQGVLVGTRFVLCLLKTPSVREIIDDFRPADVACRA